MTIVGIDIGATKTHVATDDGGGSGRELVVATSSWRAEGSLGEASAILALARRALGGAAPRALAVGAHGCDDAARCRALQQAVADLSGAAVLVVNDAELFVPAAGFEQGIGVVAGTGSIAVARLADGTMLVAGGWGWFLGDEGGAVGLVREAVRAARGALDAGETADALIACLRRSLGTDDPVLFAQTLLQAQGAAGIGAHVQAVFEALAAGSALAQAVVREGGEALALLVRRLAGRGAASLQVVTAGGVVSNQPALFEAFRAALAATLPEARLVRLDVPPVAGATALARRIAEGRAPFGLAPAFPPGWAPSA